MDAVTGTLKTALTFELQLVVITTAAGVTFVTNVDIVIASTILARVTVTTATPTLSVTGTLKAALIGATTSIVIETASGILFLNTAEVVIGSSTVVSANVNTATDNDAPTSVVVTTAAGVTFRQNDAVVIGSMTVLLANVNSATNTVFL